MFNGEIETRLTLTRQIEASILTAARHQSRDQLAAIRAILEQGLRKLEKELQEIGKP